MGVDGEGRMGEVFGAMDTPAQPKTIVTIQHPESEHHTNGMVGSWKDWPLTERGLEQAAAIARNLGRELGARRCALFSSPLQRTRQTAEAVAAQLDVVPVFSNRLRERNLGAAVGQSVEWLRENMEQPERTIDDRCFSDAESRRDLWNRLYPFYDELITSEAETVVIVSHGDTLALFNAMWLRQDPEFLNGGDLYGLSGGVSFLHQTAEGRRVIRCMSDLSFMQRVS